MAFDLKRVLKVLLFAANGPLSVKDIQSAIARGHENVDQAVPAGVTETEVAEDAGVGTAASPPADDEMYRDVPALVTTAEIREAIGALSTELAAGTGDVLLVEGHQGWRLVTHPRFARWVRLLRHEPPPVRLSPSSLETLAVIAYRQPVTRAEIERIRGVAAEAGLARLLERELICVVGRADLPGRPIQYGTTDDFLEFVGVRSLDDLPSSDVLSPRQIDAWLQSANHPRAASDSDMGLDETEVTPLPVAGAATTGPEES